MIILVIVIGPQVSIFAILVILNLSWLPIILICTYWTWWCKNIKLTRTGRNRFLPDQFKPTLAETCQPCSRCQHPSLALMPSINTWNLAIGQECHLQQHGRPQKSTTCLLFTMCICQHLTIVDIDMQAVVKNNQKTSPHSNSTKQCNRHQETIIIIIIITR